MPGLHRFGRVLSLFSGAGGLDLGLERAGFTTVACLEIDEDARSVLAANRRRWNVLEDGDVVKAAKTLKPSDVGLKSGELELIAGGPPCQPFSKAAQWHRAARMGMLDPRAQTVNGMFDLVENFLPRAVMVENVSGFLQGKNSALDAITSRLEDINQRHCTNYEFMWEIVDAADYGVPQHRQRAIAFAFRDGVKPVIPSPTHAHRPVRAWDALWDVREDEKPHPSGYWTGLLPSIPEGKNYLHHTARGEGQEVFGWRTRYWSFLLKLAKDRPSWTLPASPGPNTGPFHWENRPLSIREQARLQSFPDSWRMVGADHILRRLIGNATPPLLAEVLGRSIIDQLALGSLEDRIPHLARRVSLQRPRRRIVPSPEPVDELPEAFKQHVGAKAAHPGEGLGPAPRTALDTGTAG